MPELRDRLVQNKKGGKKDDANVRFNLPHFEPAGPEVDIFAIPYLDHHREAARQKRLQENTETGDTRFARKSNPRHTREKGRDIKREHVGKTDAEKGSKSKSDKKRGRHAKIVEEWDDLAKEERLYKKLRQKKITQEQFDSELYEREEK